MLGINLDSPLRPPGNSPEIARRAFAGSNRSNAVPEDTSLGVWPLPNAVADLPMLEKSGNAII